MLANRPNVGRSVKGDNMVEVRAWVAVARWLLRTPADGHRRHTQLQEVAKFDEFAVQHKSSNLSYVVCRHQLEAVMTLRRTLCFWVYPGLQVVEGSRDLLSVFVGNYGSVKIPDDDASTTR